MRFNQPHPESVLYRRRLLYSQLACAALAVSFGYMSQDSGDNFIKNVLTGIPFLINVLAMLCYFSVFGFPIASIVLSMRLRTSAGTTLVSFCMSVVLSFVTLYGLLPGVQ